MPTTNPVPSNDPTDLLFNAQKLDQVVNGSAQYYTDRLGVNRRTVEGISAAADVVLGGLGYAPPVTYASGISMTLTTQTVEYSGEVYAPKVASLPFTTSTWATDSAKFRLIQGVAATDLAASGGAGMIGYMPEGAGAVATMVQAKLRESVSVKDFKCADGLPVQGDGIHDDTTGIQAAIDAVGNGTVEFPTGQYVITSTLNCTTTASKDRRGLSMVAAGGIRGGVTILCRTGGWAVDITGSAWQYWKGLYFWADSGNKSKGGFFAAGSAEFTECQSHTFDHVFVEIYNTSAPASYGTIGYALIGAEENTWIGCKTVANTPYVFSTGYNAISADYPAAYGVPQASHSCGVNTFSGSNSAITWDFKSAPFVLFGANTLDFGNMYVANINIGAPGTSFEVIRVLGGNIEGVKGRIKVEGRKTILNITSYNANMYGWKLHFTWGAVVANEDSWVYFNNTTAFSGEWLDSEINIDLYSSAATEFNNKPFVGSINAFDESGAGKFSNLKFSINKPAANVASPMFSSTMVGTSFNVRFEMLDLTYTLVDRTSQKLKVKEQRYLGLGNAATSVQAKLRMPSIVAGYGAVSGWARVSGTIYNINTADGSAANEADVTSSPFDVVSGFVAPNTGAVAVGTAGGDSLMTTAASAVSTNASLYKYTGVNLDLNYTTSPRAVEIKIGPKGTGPSLGGIFAFVDNLEIEVNAVGRREDLYYVELV